MMSRYALRRESAEVASALAAEKAKVAGTSIETQGAATVSGYTPKPNDKHLFGVLAHLVRMEDFVQMASSHGAQTDWAVSEVQDLVHRFCDGAGDPIASATAQATISTNEPAIIPSTQQPAEDKSQDDHLMDQDLDEALGDASLKLTPEQRASVKATISKKKKDRKK